MIGIPNPRFSLVPAATGRITPAAGGLSIGAFRLPADPLFFADLVLNNVVAGSRYRVTQESTGDELATGVAAGTTVTLSGLPCFENPMLVEINVRNASGSPTYRPFRSFAEMVKAGSSAFVSQELDE